MESRPTFSDLISEYSSQLQALAEYLQLNETVVAIKDVMLVF